VAAKVGSKGALVYSTVQDASTAAFQNEGRDEPKAGVAELCSGLGSLRLV